MRDIKLDAAIRTLFYSANGNGKNLEVFFEKEVKNGRFPKGIKLIHAPLPASLQREIEVARKVASDETSPKRANAL